MKLSRALLERRDLTRKISRIKEEIESVLITSENEEVEEITIKSMFDQLRDKMAELEVLNLRIDKVNAVKLMEKLNSLKIADSKIDFLKKCRSKLLQGNDSMKYYSRVEIKEKKNISLSVINIELETIENFRKDLDSEIQEINWTTDI